MTTPSGQDPVIQKLNDIEAFLIGQHRVNAIYAERMRKQRMTDSAMRAAGNAKQMEEWIESLRITRNRLQQHLNNPNGENNDH